MAEQWDNYPLSPILGGMGSALGQVIAYCAALWLATGLVLVCVVPVEGGIDLGVPVAGVPLVWFYGMFVGLLDYWGFLVYPLLGLLLAVVLFGQWPRPHVYLAAVLIQMAESTRLFAQSHPIRWGLLVVMVLLVLAGWGLWWWLYERYHRGIELRLGRTAAHEQSSSEVSHS